SVGVPRLAGDTETQKLFTARAELVDLVSFRTGAIAGEIRYPDVAVLVDRDAVRRHHHAFADVGEHRAGLAIELEDRIDRIGFAIDRPAPGATARASAAALVSPDVAV